MSLIGLVCGGEPLSAERLYAKAIGLMLAAMDGEISQSGCLLPAWVSLRQTRNIRRTENIGELSKTTVNSIPMTQPDHIPDIKKMVPLTDSERLKLIDNALRDETEEGRWLWRRLLDCCTGVKEATDYLAKEASVARMAEVLTKDNEL